MLVALAMTTALAHALELPGNCERPKPRRRIFYRRSIYRIQPIDETAPSR
jgi:hypothetical protein